ncbi:MAG: hypothetical protein WCZ89_03695 [Phycisphaerae bacterium]
MTIIRQDQQDKNAISIIRESSKKTGLDIHRAKIRRTSSRFCLGVEHGDYNGTELFGVGTDRFIWLGYKPNDKGQIRAYSINFPDDGIIDLELGSIEKNDSEKLKNSWGRFVGGTDFVLRNQGYKLTRGIDAVIYGNIPGGGMSRSASLTLNLILSLLEVNEIEITDKFKLAELAKSVENDFIGSPCGILDQIMIAFSKQGYGTLYNPKKQNVSHIPAGKWPIDFRFVCLDTGTVRPGLEKSTYKIRRAQCQEFVAILKKNGYDIEHLADIKEESRFDEICAGFGSSYPNHCELLRYIFFAQKRLYQMLDAWRSGDIAAIGRIFRQDGIGLRDEYKISGPELETMCEIARGAPGVLGERMLGGGDKGAAGVIVKTENLDDLKKAIDEIYPKKYPSLADKYAIHTCNTVDGIVLLEDLI